MDFQFADVVGELRAFASGFMIEETDIIRDVTTEVEPGYPRTEAEVIATTRSWGETLGAREQIVVNQAGYEADAARYLPVGTDVLPSDRLSIGGKVWEIESVEDQGTQAMQPYIRVLVSSRE